MIFKSWKLRQNLAHDACGVSTPRQLTATVADPNRTQHAQAGLDRLWYPETPIKTNREGDLTTDISGGLVATSGPLDERSGATSKAFDRPAQVSRAQFGHGFPERLADRCDHVGVVASQIGQFNYG